MSISLQDGRTGTGSRAPTSIPLGGRGAADAADLAEQLAQERRRLEAVTAILDGWVWQTDGQHRFVYMSPSVERLTGKLPQKHYGKTLEDLGIISVGTSSASNWHAQLEARGELGPVDFVRYDNGKPLFMRTSGRPQLDADGRFCGYIGLAFVLPDNAVEQATERRNATRRRTVRAAEIMLPSESSPISCVMVDLSTTGARLSVPDGLVLPDAFDLRVDALSLSSRCELRWRRDGEAGVAFVAKAGA